MFLLICNIGVEIDEVEVVSACCSEKVCALLNFRAQDKAAMQLSELEEEMDQRIQAAEHKMRNDVSLWDWPFLPTIPDGSPFTDRAPGRVFHESYFW